jgi:starch synthase (maltosyl-transferring)
LAARFARVPAVFTGIRVADPRRWRRFEAWLSNWAKRIVCVSRSVADFCAARGFTRNRLAVIPNAIETNIGHPEGEPGTSSGGSEILVPGRQNVVFVGRLDEQKGLDILIKAWTGVAARFPAYDLLLVGDGPQRGTVQEWATASGVADRVRLLGWRPDVAEILSRCDLFVLPSRWEGMPNALLEAMACGLPAVATDVEGVREVLGEGADEQVVPPGSAAELAARIERFLGDPDSARTLGARNRQRVESEFSLPQMIARYVALYREV